MPEYSTFSHTGRVAGTSNWSNSYVRGSSSGGGGYLVGGTGFVDGPSTNISTNVVERQRFFIVRDDGIEQAVTLSNNAFPVRDGHRVTVVYGCEKGNENGWALLARNHSTGQTLEMREGLESLRAPASARAWAFGIWAAILGDIGMLAYGISVDGVERALRDIGEVIFALLVMGVVFAVVGAMISAFWFSPKVSRIDKRLMRLAHEALEEETKHLREQAQDADDEVRISGVSKAG